MTASQRGDVRCGKNMEDIHDHVEIEPGSVRSPGQSLWTSMLDLDQESHVTWPFERLLLERMDDTIGLLSVGYLNVRRNANS